MNRNELIESLRFDLSMYHVPKQPFSSRRYHAYRGIVCRQIDELRALGMAIPEIIEALGSDFRTKICWPAY